MGAMKLRNDGILLDVNGAKPIWIGSVSGAPSSDQSSGAALVQVAIRQDAASGSALLYISYDTGSNWATFSGSNETQKVATSAVDAAAIPVSSQGTVRLTTAGAETRTLAAPTWAGQTLSIYFQTDGGDCVVTAAAAINQAGNTVMTFADAGDCITLVGVHNGSVYVWRVLANDGVALS